MYQIVLILTLVAGSVSAASAQMAEATLFGGRSHLGNADIGEVGFSARSLALDGGFKVGGRLSLNGSAFMGHELSYGFERQDLAVGGEKETTAHVQQFFYDFVVHLTPKALPVRPFVLAGAGFSSFSPRQEGILAAGAGETKVGYNYGGGVKVKLSPLFGVRFDVRDHVTGKPNFLDLPNVSGKLHSVEFSAGVSLLF